MEYWINECTTIVATDHPKKNYCITSFQSMISSIGINQYGILDISCITTIVVTQSMITGIGADIGAPLVPTTMTCLNVISASLPSYVSTNFNGQQRARAP